MRHLTTRETARVSGVRDSYILKLIHTRTIAPAVMGSDGRGRGHRFSPGQAFALYVARVYRDADAGHDRAMGVLCFLWRQSIEALEAHFADGRTFPVPASLASRAASQEGMEGSLPGFLVALPDDLPVATRKLLKRVHLPDLLTQFKRSMRVIDGTRKMRQATTV